MLQLAFDELGPANRVAMESAGAVLPLLHICDTGRTEEVNMGLGRIVVSEIDVPVPNMLVDLV